MGHEKDGFLHARRDHISVLHSPLWLLGGEAGWRKASREHGELSGSCLNCPDRGMAVGPSGDRAGAENQAEGGDVWN